MSRLPTIQPENTTGKTKELLDATKKKLGKVPNLVRVFANSPAVLEAYLNFSGALGGGILSPKLREGLSLTVGQANSCNYCLAAHSTIGKLVGLSEEEILENRRGRSEDHKIAVALQFAQEVVRNRGFVSDEDFQALKDAHFTDEEITEIIANISLNLFTNYFNHIAGTEVDFPAISELSDKEEADCGCSIS